MTAPTSHLRSTEQRGRAQSLDCDGSFFRQLVQHVHMHTFTCMVQQSPTAFCPGAQSDRCANVSGANNFTSICSSLAGSGDGDE